MQVKAYLNKLLYGLPTESKCSLPKEGNKEPLLNVVTTELEVVAAVTCKRRLSRFWAFSAGDMVGSFSARLNSILRGKPWLKRCNIGCGGDALQKSPLLSPI